MSRLTANGPTTDHHDTAVEDSPEAIGHSRRCDACGAAAYVVVHLKISTRLPRGGQLAFCAHHYSAHETALASYVSRRRDERHLLTGSR